MIHIVSRSITILIDDKEILYSIDKNMYKVKRIAEEEIVHVVNLIN